MAVNENVRINFEATNLDVVEGRIKAIGGAINILGGAVETTVGLMGMIGVDEKQTKKFQEMATSAIALADGTKRVFEGYKELREAQQLFTKATEAQTVAQGASNAAATAGAGAFDKLRIAMVKNPITAIVVGLTALAAGIYLFSQRTDDAEEAQTKLNDAMDEAVNSTRSEALAIENLSNIMRDNSVPLAERKQAYTDLQALVPALTTYTFQEALANKELNTQIATQVKLLQLKAQQNALNKLYEEEYLNYIKELNKAEGLTAEQRKKLAVSPSLAGVPTTVEVAKLSGTGFSVVGKETRQFNQDLVEATNTLLAIKQPISDITNEINKLSASAATFKKAGSLAPTKFISRKEVEEFKTLLNTSFTTLVDYQTNIRKALDRAKANEKRDTEDYKEFAKLLGQSRNESAQAQLETLRNVVNDNELYSKIIKETTTEIVIDGKKQQLSLEELAKATDKGARDLTLAYKLITLPKEVLGLNTQQFDKFRTDITTILTETNAEIVKQVGKFPNAFFDQGKSVKIIGDEIIQMIKTQGDLTAEAAKELVDKFNKSISKDVLSKQQFEDFFKSLTLEEQQFVDKSTRTLKLGGNSREAFLSLYLKLQKAYNDELKFLYNEELDARIQQGEEILAKDENLIVKLQALTIQKNKDIAEAERLGKKEQLDALNAFYNQEAIQIITEGFVKQKEMVDYGVNQINNKMRDIEFPEDAIVPADIEPMLKALDDLQVKANAKINDYYNSQVELANKYGIDTTELEKQRTEALIEQGDKFKELRVSKEKEANKQILDNQKSFNDQTEDADKKRLEGQIRNLDKYIEKVKQIAGEESEQVKKLIALRKQLSDQIKANSSDLVKFFEGDVAKTIGSSLNALSSITGMALDMAVQDSEQKLNKIEAEAQERAKNVVGTEEEVAYQLEVIEYEKNVAMEAERKKAFDDQKKLRIADTITTGLASAFQAFGGAMQLGPIAGPIVGGILSAMILAQMAKTVQTIQKQQYIGSTPTAPKPPSINTGGGGATGGTATPLIGGQFNQPIPNPNDPGNNPFGNNTNNPMNSPQGMGMNNEPIRAYVVSSDVQNGLQAEQQLQNRRRL